MLATDVIHTKGVIKMRPTGRHTNLYNGKNETGKQGLARPSVSPCITATVFA